MLTSCSSGQAPCSQSSKEPSCSSSGKDPLSNKAWEDEGKNLLFRCFKGNRPAAVLAKSFISVSKQFRFPFLLTYSSQKLVEFFRNEQANLSPEKALPEISVSQYFSAQTPNKDNYSDFQGVKSVSGFSPRVAFTTVTDLKSKAETEPGLCCKASLLK